MDNNLGTASTLFGLHIHLRLHSLPYDSELRDTRSVAEALVRVKEDEMTSKTIDEGT
jgi:hypothetical protein